jgi:uncharacterized protein (TIGR02246 family)
MTTELEELRERLRKLEDREEIRRLIQEYRRTLDERDLHAFSLLYAANGSWSGRSGEATGPQAIRTMLEAALPDNPPAPGPTLFHLGTDPVIELDGDRATAFTFWMHCRRGEGDTTLLPTLGRYDDVLTREDGRWRFLRRQVTGLIPADAGQSR